MKFVDKVSLFLKAGHGGAGAVSFRREKYVPNGGPDGGKGGQGGSIIFQASQKLQTLMDLSTKKKIKAESGEKGHGKNQTGKNGKDTLIPVPRGTMIFNEEGDLIGDLCVDGDTFIAANGGRGGLGNASFKSSTQRVPRHSQTGEPGDELTVDLELRMIADVALIGTPNAGKSTLLKTLTFANPKIGNYPFTTLYPNLGVLKFPDQEIVIADIPGLIEGSSSGLGLGNDFLRHIGRTNILVHVIGCDNLDLNSPLSEFELIENEIKQTSFNLKDKKRLIVLSKIDLMDENQLKSVLKLFKNKKVSPICISSFSKEGINELITEIRKAHNEFTSHSS